MSNASPRVEKRVPLSKHGEQSNYRPGGFHPVHLGDVLKKGRYEIVHKLGHGGFATVWLARDSQRQRYVAVKILAARLSRDCHEVEISRHLLSGPDTLGKSHVLVVLDHFWKHGPNGDHLCVVSAVGGPSIKQFNECPGQLKGSRRLKATVARKVALQATQALKYIHSKGIVHGDYTSANILLQLASIDAWTIEQIHERLGTPQTQKIDQSETSESESPRYTVAPINMSAVDPQWLIDEIIIIDFGIAFQQAHVSIDIGTPKSYCAPEFLFGEGRSIASDIWALGCTIFEIRTGTQLFSYKTSPSKNKTLKSMIKLLGTLPHLYWEIWKEGRGWYEAQTESGDLGDNPTGKLLYQLMKTGVHDGDIPRSQGSQKDSSSKSPKNDHGPRLPIKSKNETRRLVALAEVLTTDEAAEVLALVNRSSSDDSKENNNKSNSNASTKEKSGSGSENKNSGSANSKNAENALSSGAISSGAISSEGISTGPPGTADDQQNGRGSADANSKEASTTCTDVEDFLEPTGTRISRQEAEALEDLLRAALTYLPEQRTAAAELLKHPWFSDQFDDDPIVMGSSSIVVEDGSKS